MLPMDASTRCGEKGNGNGNFSASKKKCLGCPLMIA
jgi:hypothetical protein